MKEFLKGLNKALRVLFIGFVGIYGLVKIFDKDQTERVEDQNREYVTSEFDEIW